LKYLSVIALEGFVFRILILILLSNFGSLVEATCGNESERVVHGKEPLASKLYEAAKATNMGAWKDGEFSQEEFTYLGDFTIKNKKPIHVTYIETIWGTSSCRGTYRLIFFNSELKQVGQYNSIDKPTFIEKNTLSIPYEDQPLTTWVFSGKLPECLKVADDCFPLQNSKEI